MHGKYHFCLQIFVSDVSFLFCLCCNIYIGFKFVAVFLGAYPNLGCYFRILELVMHVDLISYLLFRRFVLLVLS
jgi:hypothetical protein